MKRIIPPLIVGALLLCNAFATVITFTGGTALDPYGNSHTTNANNVYFNTSTYIENGFRLDYITSGSYQMQPVGDYYGTGNDVIHGHWTSGLQSIDVKSTTVGATFDLNYFILTSNTSHGGGDATGLETVYVQGYRNGSAVTGSYLLPSENWGLETTKNVVLDSSFDNIDLFRISGSGAFCFGMDAFYLNESAPVQGVEPLSLPGNNIPETSAAVLGGLGMLTLLRRKRI